MYVKLPANGGMWIERLAKSYGAHAVREDGELLVWLGRWHAILTPPWWKPKPRLSAA